jgi:dihydropteroate synthase
LTGNKPKIEEEIKMTRTKHEQMEQFMEELKAWKEEQLEGLTGDDLLFKKITVDLEINKKWQEKRTELYSRTQEDVEAEFLGKKTRVFGARRKSMSTRVVRKDEEGRLFIRTDGGKAIVEWNPVFRSLEIKYYEYK